MRAILIAAALCAGSAGDPSPRRPGFILLSAVLLFPIGYYSAFLRSVMNDYNGTCWHAQPADVARFLREHIESR